MPITIQITTNLELLLEKVKELKKALDNLEAQGAVVSTATSADETILNIEIRLPTIDYKEATVLER